MTRSRITDFGRYISEFLMNYLPIQRGYSKNTIKSYRDTFKQLIKYICSEHNVKPDAIEISYLTKETILNFLNKITEEDGLSISTRNNRLSAIHSFLRFVLFEAPENLYNFQQIFEIPFRRKPHAEIGSLEIEEIKAIINSPDLSTRRGVRDATILSLLYDSGARVQEIIDLRNIDFIDGIEGSIVLQGKGNKKRKVPLSSEMVRLLKQYFQLFSIDRSKRPLDPMFWNNRGEKFTRNGIAYILNKYANIARKSKPSIPNRVHPHMLRHSKAIHLLEAGVYLPIIQDFLGHADPSTTTIYAKVSLKLKADAIEKACSPSVIENRPSDWTEQADLMKLLDEL